MQWKGCPVSHGITPNFTWSIPWTIAQVAIWLVWPRSCTYGSATLHKSSYDGHDLYVTSCTFNTLRPRQNGRHFAHDTFNHIFVNENEWISIKISLKFVPKGQINNIPSLFQIMAWRRPGDKPLSEAMMVSLLTHICITLPQWVKLQIHSLGHDQQFFATNTLYYAKVTDKRSFHTACSQP